MVDNEIHIHPYSLNSELCLVWKRNQAGHGHWAWEPKTHPRPAMMLSPLVPPKSLTTLYYSLGPRANMFRMATMPEAGSPQICHQANSAAPSAFPAVPKHQMDDRPNWWGLRWAT